MGEEQGPECLPTPIVPHPLLQGEHIPTPSGAGTSWVDLAMTSYYHTDILFYADDKSLGTRTFILFHLGESLAPSKGEPYHQQIRLQIKLGISGRGVLPLQTQISANDQLVSSEMGWTLVN